jgi:hypothetical protein
MGKFASNWRPGASRTFGHFKHRQLAGNWHCTMQLRGIGYRAPQIGTDSIEADERIRRHKKAWSSLTRL